MFVFCAVLGKGKEMLAAGTAENPIAFHVPILQEIFALDGSPWHELQRTITPGHVP